MSRFSARGIPGIMGVNQLLHLLPVNHAVGDWPSAATGLIVTDVPEECSNANTKIPPANGGQNGHNEIIRACAHHSQKQPRLPICPQPLTDAIARAVIPQPNSKNFELKSCKIHNVYCKTVKRGKTRQSFRLVVADTLIEVLSMTHQNLSVNRLLALGAASLICAYAGPVSDDGEAAAAEQPNVRVS